MLVKCKCHGNKIDRDVAFKINVNGKNEYYCSENEYIKIQNERNNKNSLFNLINDIFGYKVINTILFKEMAEISKIHSYTKIHSYVNQNISELNKFMSKSFNSEYGKIKYFTAILKNNLTDYKEPKQEINKKTNEEIIEVKYTAKPRKKSISEYLEEMEELN